MRDEHDTNDHKHLDNDDELVGELLSRRRALRLFGLLGGGALLGGAALSQVGRSGPGGSAASGLPGCVVRPAMSEGPYFVDEKLMRSDIRKDSGTGRARAGVPLTLTFVVSRVGVGSCEPQRGVLVDVWQCDAVGAYSGVTDTQDWLRGSQLTDARGHATFTTIYPGAYPGRAVHIHFKLRTTQGSRTTGEFTSQLFFPEDVTDRVHGVAPYNANSRRTTPNSADMIYRNGGSQLLLDVKGDVKSGFAATFDVGLNLG